ncbi:hypothetical protein EDF85_1058 [Pseudomonas putida]|jgi:hypothetical protein|uniref:Uncharacterized protein n=1 Tax=Pseudomonas putida TaxID=303 RepID=A0A9X8HLJ0_PSEPU|nr:hypothetical protein EDF85_1058 [Pseudomonas putida]
MSPQKTHAQWLKGRDGLIERQDVRGALRTDNNTAHPCATSHQKLYLAVSIMLRGVP